MLEIIPEKYFDYLLFFFSAGNTEGDQCGLPEAPCDPGQAREGPGSQGGVPGLYHLADRSLRGREDNHFLRPGRVLGQPGNPCLQSGWGQHPYRAEQEPGVHSRGPRGEHPTYF